MTYTDNISTVIACVIDVMLPMEAKIRFDFER